MSADESVPMGQLTPEVLGKALAAAGPELEAVSKRHAEAAAQRRDGGQAERHPADADRGWLLDQVRLRDAQIRVLSKELERLRAHEAEWAEAERAAVDEAARLRPIVEAVAEVNIEGGLLPLGLRYEARAALRPAGTLASPRPEHAAPGWESAAARAGLAGDGGEDVRPGTLASLPLDGECDGSDR